MCSFQKIVLLKTKSLKRKKTCIDINDFFFIISHRPISINKLENLLYIHTHMYIKKTHKPI